MYEMQQCKKPLHMKQEILALAGKFSFNNRKRISYI